MNENDYEIKNNEWGNHDIEIWTVRGIRKWYECMKT